MSQSFSHIENIDTTLKLYFIFVYVFFRLLDHPMQAHQKGTILTHLSLLTVLELFPFLGQNLELEFAWSFTLKKTAKKLIFCLVILRMFL